MFPFEVSVKAVFTELFAFFTSALMIFTGIGLSPSDNFSPRDEANIKTEFAVFADTHLEINPADEGVIRFEVLRKGLIDLKTSKNLVSTLVLLGDNTENGQLFEYMALNGYLRAFNRTPNFMMAMGNHETFGWNHDAVYSGVIKNFTTYYNNYTGEKLEKAYYSKVIDGCTFIVLGTEEIVAHHEYLSPEQLSWLEGVLDDAKANDHPIFIFNHQPLEGTHDSYHIDDCVGEQSAELYSIISRYENLFYLSGHRHFDWQEGLTYQETAEGIHLFSLPSFGKSAAPGNGMVVEVYPDSVVLRARDFANGEWVEGFEYDIAID